jgi:beta-N-acetylhexosaminidase
VLKVTRLAPTCAMVLFAAACVTACSAGSGPEATGAQPTAPSPTGARPTAPSSRGGHATTPPPSHPTTTAPACTNGGVIARWTVARKAALVLAPPVYDFDQQAEQVAAADGAGGLLFLGSATPPANLASQLAAAFGSRAQSIRPLVMADEEGGGIQRLAGGAVASMPWPRQMAATMTPGQVQSLGRQMATGMRSLGVTVDLAPVVDVDGRPGPSASNPDGLRSFSADPATAARYGVAFMQGVESAGVVPVVKHFPGLGGTTRNTDYGPAATLPLDQLEEGGLVPFRAAIAARAPAVMVSNATVPGLTTLPASLSAAAITGLLRHQLGFGGLVMTDSLSAGAITAAGYSLPAAVVGAISAGADMVMFGSTLTPAQTAALSPAALDYTVHQLVASLQAAVANGSLPVSRLDQAVGHVLAAGGVNLCS